jgi:hypothetical protein
MEFWVEDVFRGIASTFGELLSMDPVTVSRKRLTYARICVGVVQGTDMPDTINLQSKLGVWQQKIEYESIPFACFRCKKSGHWAKQCPANGKGPQKTNKEWVRKEKKNMGSLVNGRLDTMQMEIPQKSDK